MAAPVVQRKKLAKGPSSDTNGCYTPKKFDVEQSTLAKYQCSHCRGIPKKLCYQCKCDGKPLICTDCRDGTTNVCTSCKKQYTLDEDRNKEIRGSLMAFCDLCDVDAMFITKLYKHVKDIHIDSNKKKLAEGPSSDTNGCYTPKKFDVKQSTLVEYKCIICGGIPKKLCYQCECDDAKPLICTDCKDDITKVCTSCGQRDSYTLDTENRNNTICTTLKAFCDDCGVNPMTLTELEQHNQDHPPKKPNAMFRRVPDEH